MAASMILATRELPGHIPILMGSIHPGHHNECITWFVIVTVDGYISRHSHVVAYHLVVNGRTSI